MRKKIRIIERQIGYADFFCEGTVNIRVVTELRLCWYYSALYGCHHPGQNICDTSCFASIIHMPFEVQTIIDYYVNILSSLR